MGHGFGVGFRALLCAGRRSRGRVDELEAVRGEELVDRVLTPALWKRTVCAEIAALLKDKKRGVRVSFMVPVRFSTRDGKGNSVFDRHIVI